MVKHKKEKKSKISSKKKVKIICNTCRCDSGKKWEECCGRSKIPC